MKLGCRRMICSSAAEKAVQFSVFLYSLALRPHDVGGDAAHAQRGQLDGLAGGIDFPQIGLAQVIFLAELGQLAARADPWPPCESVAWGWLRYDSGSNKHQDRAGIADLVPEDAVAGSSGHLTRLQEEVSHHEHRAR